MNSRNSKKDQKGKLTREEMDQIVRKARQAQDEREKGYRERSLSIHPWVCAKCGREFTHKNLHLLTVHHKDHNHDNNPPDGSNWENLCVYCHDNEHSRYIDHLAGGSVDDSKGQGSEISHNPFAGLGEMLKKKNEN